MYKRKIGLAIVLIIAGIGLYFTYAFYRVFFAPNTTFNNTTSYVFITSDASVNALMEELTPLLKSPDDFRLAAQKKGYLDRIRGGKYAIRQGMNNNEIINGLRVRSLPIRVTFNNQERLANLAGRVADQIEADSLSLIEQFLDADFLSKSGFTPETALAMYVPNSYELFWNTSAAKFQQRLLKEYKRFWTPKRLAAAEEKGLTPIEVITLASIVQKESAKVDERPSIAGVYLNRLRKRIRLQADPTVIYALKKERNDFDLVIRRVLKKDLKLKSSYNTYRIKGLPPGPIGMPDVSAIDAVLFPKQHKYIYFVADPTKPGYHDFSTNLREHNRKARRYYRWLNEQRLYR
jgi:UPF0755 protein